MPPNAEDVKLQSLFRGGGGGIKNKGSQKQGSKFEQHKMRHPSNSTNNGPGSHKPYVEVWGEDDNDTHYNINNNLNNNSTLLSRFQSKFSIINGNYRTTAASKNNIDNNKPVSMLSARKFLWVDDEIDDDDLNDTMVISTKHNRNNKNKNSNSTGRTLPMSSGRARASNFFGNGPRRYGGGTGGNGSQKDSDKDVNLMDFDFYGSSLSQRSQASPPDAAFSFLGTFRGSFRESFEAGEGRNSDEYLSRSSHYWSSRGSYILRLCLSPLIALAIILFIAFITRRIILENEDLVQTIEYNETRYKAIRATLLDVSNGTLLDLEGTPQYNALHWLTTQDPARLQATDQHIIQRFVLAVLFFSTSGQLKTDQRPNADWVREDHWMTGRSFCKWYGVVCQGHTIGDVNNNNNKNTKKAAYTSGTEDLHVGDIVALNLTKNALKGSLPPELQHLDHVRHIDLSGNEMNGLLPTEIAQLRKLKQLHLQANQFSGGVPTEFGTISTLTSLRLGGNNLEGSIPRELRKASMLQMLDLGYNQLDGTVPDFTSVTSLAIAPQLNIPDEGNHLRWLEYLYLNNNQLVGTIPETLGALTTLKQLHLQSNQLTGRTVPKTFRFLIHATEIKFHSNDLKSNENQEDDDDDDEAVLVRSSTVCRLVNMTGLILTSDCNEKFICECCQECY